MVRRLTFRACIFSGIVCQECSAAVDNVDMKPAKLKRHWNQKHDDDMECDEKKEFHRVTVEMKNLARCLSAFHTDNDKKNMCEVYLDEINGVWCNHENCQRGYKNGQQHSGEKGRTQHKDDGHFTPQMLKFPNLPEKTTLFFPQHQWDFATYEANFSKYFNKFYVPAANQMQAAVNPQLANVFRTQILQHLPPW
jgi:hypothetical protein